MTWDSMYQQTGVNFFLIAAMLVIGMMVPMVAGYILDGVVAVLRGRGMKLLVGAIGLTSTVAAIGYGVWKWNVERGVGYLALELFAEGMRGSIRMLWQFSVPVSVIAFVVRTVSAFARRG